MAGMLLGVLKGELKWANALVVKETLDTQLLAYLGPKDERDDPKALVCSVQLVLRINNPCLEKEGKI